MKRVVKLYLIDISMDISLLKYLVLIDNATRSANYHPTSCGTVITNYDFNYLPEANRGFDIDTGVVTTIPFLRMGGGMRLT